MSRWILFCLIATRVIGVLQAGGGNSTVGADVTPDALAIALAVETNRVRREHHAKPLKLLPELRAAAEDQASYMALRLTTTHQNAFYGQENVAARAARHGFHPLEIAENVATLPAAESPGPVTAARLAENLVAAWMKSPGHRANLLNPKFKYLGCAARIASGFRGVEYVFATQVFSTDASPEQLRL